MRFAWHILTGEYPPQTGGVSDYTRQVACGLARIGDEVCVWAPPVEGSVIVDDGVEVRRLPDRFGPQSLYNLDAELRRERRNYRLLVQYLPQMYGWRAMNVALCGWLRWACPVRPWVMFHEVAVAVARGNRLRHNIMGLVHCGMAKALLRAAERVFVSAPWWLPQLRRLAPQHARATWLPIPSNIPTVANPERAAAVRALLLPSTGGQLIGHFGTYGPLVADDLVRVLPPLLRREPGRVALLVGRGGLAVVERLALATPELAGRISATESLADEEVAAHLAACDLLIQPFPDGASSRRTSLMAGLALGRPIVTTAGPATEALWQHSGAVVLAPAGNPVALTEAAEALLRDDGRLRLLTGRASTLYRSSFTLERTVETLRTAAGATAPGASRGLLMAGMM